MSDLDPSTPLEELSFPELAKYLCSRSDYGIVIAALVPEEAGTVDTVVYIHGNLAATCGLATLLAESTKQLLMRQAEACAEQTDGVPETDDDDDE